MRYIVVARAFGRSIKEVRDEWSVADFLDAETLMAAEGRAQAKARKAAAAKK